MKVWQGRKNSRRGLVKLRRGDSRGTVSIAKENNRKKKSYKRIGGTEVCKAWGIPLNNGRKDSPKKKSQECWGINKRYQQLPEKISPRSLREQRVGNY